MKWSPGDIAICHCDDGKDHADLHGKTVTLLKYVGNNYQFQTGQKRNRTQNAWLVDAGQTQKEITVNEKCLRKPYDGNELCSWSDCIWQPETERVF